MASNLPAHGVPSALDVSSWSLRVDGAVERPRRFSRDDLDAFERRTVTEAFTCVEGWTASDLTWRGVPLAALLAAVDPRPTAAYALVHAVDGDYACAFDRDHLAASLLAVELDGDPLPPEHGGPARLVPAATGADCWESVKWVTRVELREDRPTEQNTARDLALSRLC